MKERTMVDIYIESNPNPNSLKFVADRMLVGEGESYDFPDAESAEHAPLASALFQFPFVRRVFYMNNFVTVTKVEQVNWEDVKLELRNFIKSYLETGKPLLTGNYQEEEVATTPSKSTDQEGAEMDERIKSILEEYIKPAVEMDGGAIQYHSFKDGVVKLLLQGSCSGCPSSTLTLKAGIENLLKTMIPEVKTVEAEGI